MNVRVVNGIRPIKHWSWEALLQNSWRKRTEEESADTNSRGKQLLKRLSDLTTLQ